MSDGRTLSRRDSSFSELQLISNKRLLDKRWRSAGFVITLAQLRTPYD